MYLFTCPPPPPTVKQLLTYVRNKLHPILQSRCLCSERKLALHTPNTEKKTIIPFNNLPLHTPIFKQTVHLLFILSVNHLIFTFVTRLTHGIPNVRQSLVKRSRSRLDIQVGGVVVL